MCIATEAHAPPFRQKFFKWPHQEAEMQQFIEKEKLAKNVWFGVNLYSTTERSKKTCLPTNLVWADLDECPPEKIEPQPQVVIESSPQRYQAIWLLDEVVDPAIAEDYSRRIYGQYRDNGVDSGWALTKLLRVPFTVNLKYVERPVVNLVQAKPVTLPTGIFDAIAEIPITEEDVEIAESVPDLGKLPSAEEIIEKHAYKLSQHKFHQLYSYEPTKDEDWSKLLWRLYHVCIDAKLSDEEIFVVANDSNFNKFKRDGRPLEYLWRDILKASQQRRRFDALIDSRVLSMPDLVPGHKFKEKSFIDEYRQWGLESTDAKPQYHDLTAFIILSALLAGNLKLQTSYDILRPNLWGLILGDSTLTRKSTSMRRGMDIVDFIDKDIVITSDASVEGLLTALQMRPKSTSVFYRDEVTGFFMSMMKKDYMAGMAEMLTKLYDGDERFTRTLAKKKITVERPVFIFFGGGIKDRVKLSLDESFVLSGFLPRFLIVSAETDLSTIKWTGPPSQESIEKRNAIYSRLHQLYTDYTVYHDVEILDQTVRQPTEVEIIMSPDAWELNAEIEQRFVEAGTQATDPSIALPTFERLARSLLKMSMLIAATRQDPIEGMIQSEAKDILVAARYIQEWGEYTIELLSGLNRSVMSAILDKAYEIIAKNPGVNRGHIMRMLNLSKREMNEIEGTLEERNQIEIFRYGRGVQYTAIEW